MFVIFYFKLKLYLRCLLLATATLLGFLAEPGATGFSDNLGSLELAFKGDLDLLLACLS